LKARWCVDDSSKPELMEHNAGGEYWCIGGDDSIMLIVRQVQCVLKEVLPVPS
jgi:hypothetical protein